MINNYAAIKFTRISLCTCCKVWLSKKTSFKSFLTRHAKLNFGKNLRREAFCCSVTSSQTTKYIIIVDCLHFILLVVVEMLWCCFSMNHINFMLTSFTIWNLSRVIIIGRKGYLLFKYSLNIDEHVKVILKVKRKMKNILIDKRRRKLAFIKMSQENTCKGYKIRTQNFIPSLST